MVGRLKSSEIPDTELKKHIRGIIKCNEPLKYHTSLRIGGPADILIIPKDKEDLEKAIALARKYKKPLCVIGNGSKILVLDKGIRGIVAKLSNVLDEIRFIEGGITAGSGMCLSKLSMLTAQKGLSGLEFAIGIPGTVGGAVVMNASAYGQSTSDILDSVTTLSMEGKTHALRKEDLEFNYRRSVLQDGREIVLDAVFNLRKEATKKIQLKIEDFVLWRKNTQPLDMPSAGSTFKNPYGDYAGRLIEAAGLKGQRIGDAQVSNHNANFIVNLGDAKAKDVTTLMSIIRERVHDRFDITLMPEIRILGE